MERADFQLEFPYVHEWQPSFARYPMDLDDSYCQPCNHGANFQTLNLFLFGRDLPR